METNPTLLCTVPLAIVLGLFAVYALVSCLAACMRSSQISEQERREGRGE